MEANPFLGIILIALAGVAAASFYIPYKKVKGWSWENYWMVGGFFSWIAAPILFAVIILPQTFTILMNSPAKAMFWTFFFGVLWGVGGLTFGMAMRYLGIALGYALALGLCAAFGTLVPPIFNGEIVDVATSTSGQVVLAGVLVCLIGIAMSGKAGVQKERELSDEQKKDSVKEFNFVKGVLVAILAGVMSAAMAYGFAAGKPIATVAIDQGAPTLWQNLPVLIIILIGGFLTNFIWCAWLITRAKSWKQFTGVLEPADKEESAEQASESTQSAGPVGAETGGNGVLLANYLLCAAAGVTWYLQFFFYGMGSTQMGAYSFSSWALQMASVIICSTLWGMALREWRGTSLSTRVWVGVGLALLIISTFIIAYGNHLGAAVAI